MSGFRLPGMLDDINIEEIVSRAPAAKKKAKLKELTGRMRGWKEKRAKTKAKSRTKAKPVVKAKAKPKPPTKPRGRPGIMVGEDLANRPKVRPTPTPRTPQLTIGQVPDSVRERFNPAFDRSKIEEIIANARIEKETGGVDSSPFPISNRFDPNAPKPEPLPRSHPFFQSESYKKFITPDAEGRRRLGTMDMYTSSDGHKFGSGTVGRMYERWLAENPSYREGTLGPKVDRPPQSREEILKSISSMLGGSESNKGAKQFNPEKKLAAQIEYMKNNPGPGTADPTRFTKTLPEDFQPGSGTLLENRDLLEEQTSSMSDEEMLAILQKLFKTEQPRQQPQQPQMPQLPQVQQWNMMGPQQPTGPIVAAGPQQPSQFMPRPQIPSEMFGSYGGTAPIVPAMAYAGMGNFPQMPRMPAPQYDPDAEPGNPPMPTGPVFGMPEIVGGGINPWSEENSTRTFSREELERMRSGAI